MTTTISLFDSLTEIGSTVNIIRSTTATSSNQLKDNDNNSVKITTDNVGLVVEDSSVLLRIRTNPVADTAGTTFSQLFPISDYNNGNPELIFHIDGDVVYTE